MLNRMFFAQNVSSGTPIVYTPNTWYYNWWAVSHINFAPVGWHTLTVVDCDNGSFLAFCNHYGLEGLVSNLTEYQRSLDGGYSEQLGGLSFSLDEENNNYGQYASYAVGLLFYGADYRVDKRIGRPVILIKDNSTDPGTLTDYDGNVYPTIKIGNYVFTYTPWKCTHLNDGTAIPYVVQNDLWAALTDKGMCGFDTTNLVFC